MARRSREERRLVVLENAASEVRSAALAWASSLTFGELAAATGIDQAQIARDFGDKDSLVEELIQYMLDPEVYERYDVHIDDLLEALPEYEHIGEALVDWAMSNDELNREGDNHDLRTEMLLWASADAGSIEWRILGDLYRKLIVGHTASAHDLLDAAKAKGATTRTDLTPQDFVVAITSVVEGLAIRSRMTPELVTDGLTGRVALALATAMIGPDSDGPSQQLARVPL